MALRRPFACTAVTAVMALAIALLGWLGPAAATPVGTPPPVAALIPGAFVPLTPTRILDTRDGTGVGGAGPVAAGTLITLPVRGAGGVPVSDVTAVLLTVTATDPTAVGYVTVYEQGTSLPPVSNLTFSPGATSTNSVLVPVSPGGSVDLFNGSAGQTQLVADVSGYLVAGSASAPGSLKVVAPSRRLDTRASASLAPFGAVSVPVTGGGVPSGISAVVLNLTASEPAAQGHLSVYADGADPPATSNVSFAADETVSNLVLAPVGADGKVRINNASSGSTGVLADVYGFVLAGAPRTAGAFGALSPARLLDARTGAGIPSGPNGVVVVPVAGRADVPAAGVSAVVLNVTALAPTADGALSVYPDGRAQPSLPNVIFAAGQATSTLVVVPLGADGGVSIVNASTGNTQITADVAGYVLAAPVTTPPQSVSRYVRNISGGSGDRATMRAEGCTDGTADDGSAAHLSLLDIGAQTTTNLPGPGVRLSATGTRVTYPQLVAAVEAYLDGYLACGPAAPTASTIAVGTNSDGDFTSYTATAKGTDWASAVVEPLRAYISGKGSDLQVIGANDIEAGFAATEAQAEQWITAYLNATPAILIENGSADGCPTDPGITGQSCHPIAVDGDITQTQTWTQADYFRLAHALSPGRVVALPQVFLAEQATQWADIDRTGATVDDHITFLGSLTEFAACGSTCSATAGDGWSALWSALAASPLTRSILPIATDLRID